MKNNLDKIDWYSLSYNPNAIEILKNNLELICWYRLSLNPNAIELLDKKIQYENKLLKNDYEDLNYYDRVYYFWLSQNPSALGLLKQNQNKINWNTLSYNESIFKDEKMPFI